LIAVPVAPLAQVAQLVIEGLEITLLDKVPLELEPQVEAVFIAQSEMTLMVIELQEHRRVLAISAIASEGIALIPNG